jgi:hypothetical protein
MKEDIKNIQSLQINIGGKTRTFNREGNVFKFSETNNFETVDGSYSCDGTCILSENVISNFEYTPLTYTEEYKQKLKDEYEATLYKNVDVINTDFKSNDKKRVRKYNQIAKKLEEYQKELEYANYNFDTVNDKAQVRERITVLSNMIVLLQWVLKQR